MEEKDKKSTVCAFQKIPPKETEEFIIARISHLSITDIIYDLEEFFEMLEKV